MPDTPDFDHLARAVIHLPTHAALVRHIAEQLRQIWNARGAADLAAYRSVGNASPLEIVRAIQEQDR